ERHHEERERGPPVDLWYRFCIHCFLLWICLGGCPAAAIAASRRGGRYLCLLPDSAGVSSPGSCLRRSGRRPGRVTNAAADPHGRHLRHVSFSLLFRLAAPPADRDQRPMPRSKPRLALTSAVVPDSAWLPFPGPLRGGLRSGGGGPPPRANPGPPRNALAPAPPRPGGFARLPGHYRGGTQERSAHAATHGSSDVSNREGRTRQLAARQRSPRPAPWGARGSGAAKQ